jgi:uncharacterized BrkB/YihY/UPF0761 family membrane protein
MGLLLWIYYTGVVLLLGGCISAQAAMQDGSQGKKLTERTDPKAQINVWGQKG